MKWWYLFWDTKWKIFIYDNDALPERAMLSNKLVNEGLWHHVVWISNSSSSVMYIDGVLDKVQVQSRNLVFGSAGYIAWT